MTACFNTAKHTFLLYVLATLSIPTVITASPHELTNNNTLATVHDVCFIITTMIGVLLHYLPQSHSTMLHCCRHSHWINQLGDVHSASRLIPAGCFGMYCNTITSIVLGFFLTVSYLQYRPHVTRCCVLSHCLTSAIVMLLRYVVLPHL